MNDSNKKEELLWKRTDASPIFGGRPISFTGNENGLKSRLTFLGNLPPGIAVLSIGCGTGIEIEKMSKDCSLAVGVDPSRTFLQKEKLRSSIGRYTLAVGEHLPLRDETFDLVLLFEVLEHVKDPVQTLTEINRVLKSNGLLFVTVPNRFYPIETHGIHTLDGSTLQLLNIGFPLFSMAPEIFRKRFERARIFTQPQIVRLLKNSHFEPIRTKYLMPPLDILKETLFTFALRRIIARFGKLPFFQVFGSNIMILSMKV